MLGATEKKADEVVAKKAKPPVGINYFLFFDGPGLTEETSNFTPNSIGKPGWTGFQTFNIVSVRARVTDSLNLDLQTRSRFTLTDPFDSKNYRVFTWESPRIGVSGKLASGESWAISGAVNTDFPYMLPSPLTGYTARQRTTIATPGAFANFRYQAKGSRWSVFSLLTPRFFLYSDRTALEPESIRAGANPANKIELVLSLSPTLNYAFSEKTSASFGTGLTYIKQVGDSWNPTSATMVSNSTRDAWHLDAVPVSLGITHTFSESFSIFPYIQAFPIAAQRVDGRNGKMADFMSTASVGMWINGSLF
jgi:hypothetical protein